MTNQLLMAAARGARIEEYNASEDEWFEMDSSLPLAHDITDDYRIHPDDERLRFGPVSSALREAAINPWNRDGTWAAPYGTWWMNLSDWLLWDEDSDELHRSLFLLILSEALCDEGL